MIGITRGEYSIELMSEEGLVEMSVPSPDYEGATLHLRLPLETVYGLADVMNWLLDEINENKREGAS